VRTRFERVAPQVRGSPAAVWKIGTEARYVSRGAGAAVHPVLTTKTWTGLGLPFRMRVLKSTRAIEVQSQAGEGRTFRVSSRSKRMSGSRA